MDAPNPSGSDMNDVGAGGGSSGFGMVGRLFEKTIGWIILGALIFAGYGIYKLGPDGRGAILSATGRIIGWVVIAAALPWLTRFFIRRLLEIGENWVGLALIAGLTLIDAIAGLTLIGGGPEGFWPWVLSLAALALAGTYNYLVAEYLAERYGGL
jgi:hypothetical protein